jgi:hypothetical protein
MYSAASDPLTPFRTDVEKARTKMDADHTSYGSYRVAQCNYNEAVDTLREAEYRLDPKACDRHYLNR